MYEHILNSMKRDKIHNYCILQCKQIKQVNHENILCHDLLQLLVSYDKEFSFHIIGIVPCDTVF